jgi:hypothetical protein
VRGISAGGTPPGRQATHAGGGEVLRPTQPLIARNKSLFFSLSLMMISAEPLAVVHNRCARSRVAAARLRRGEFLPPPPKFGKHGRLSSIIRAARFFPEPQQLTAAETLFHHPAYKYSGPALLSHTHTHQTQNTATFLYSHKLLAG